MRTPLRHSLLVFKSVIVGTAHSGSDVFVMTKAERKRHVARILAFGSRLLQGQAKVKTHDVAHACFPSWTKVHWSGRRWRYRLAFLTGELASWRGCRLEKNVQLLAALLGRMETAAQDAVQNGELAQGANVWTRQLARFGNQWCKCAQGRDAQ